MNEQIPQKDPLKKDEGAPQEKKISGSFLIKPLRTYEDDVKNAVQRDNVSTAKIMMAEQQRREAEKAEVEENSPTSKPNLIKIMASIVLILLGLGSAGYAYYYFSVQKNSDIRAEPTIVGSGQFILPDRTVEVEAFGQTNREVVGQIRKIIKQSKETLPTNQILEIVVVRTEKTFNEGVEKSNKVIITTQDFFKIIEAEAPPELPRSLSNQFFLGVHSSSGGAKPFILFKSQDYDLTYASMLEWEPLLIGDIRDIFYEKLGSSQAFADEPLEKNVNQPAPQTVSEQTSTSSPDSATSSSATLTSATTTPNYQEPKSATPTTTPPVKTSEYNPRDFIDHVLANRDTRAIFNQAGGLLFFYSLIDRQNLIMANDFETLSAITTRINSANIAR